jgi:hypothetical protein
MNCKLSSFTCSTLKENTSDLRILKINNYCCFCYLSLVCHESYKSHCANWLQWCALLLPFQISFVRSNVINEKHSTGKTALITQFRALSSSVVLAMAVLVEQITDFDEGQSTLTVINLDSRNCLFNLKTDSVTFTELFFIHLPSHLFIYSSLFGVPYLRRRVRLIETIVYNNCFVIDQAIENFSTIVDSRSKL